MMLQEQHSWLLAVVLLSYSQAWLACLCRLMTWVSVLLSARLSSTFYSLSECVHCSQRHFSRWPGGRCSVTAHSTAPVYLRLFIFFVITRSGGGRRWYSSQFTSHMQCSWSGISKQSDSWRKSFTRIRWPEYDPLTNLCLL